MYIYITVAVLPLVAHIVACDNTKEPSKNIKQTKTTLKTTAAQASTSEVPTVLQSGSLWDTPQTSRMNNQPEVWGKNIKRYEMIMRAPHSLTKLAKTLSLGFDPSFSKDYFEPFERRPRPVTLVAFRKKGYAARHTIKHSSRSSEVAEQQSPFNQVSHFWQNTEIDE
ncbi:hypothetical protein PYW08_000266 [Mythimna loreyi]|uniref:Uncharacterized protein n=1 Tax=Mythimna loreyi TaxID=667449 RepID=A0ACC2RAA8_9NEOP|nr:hypothetical protein PYW08_000266 [Mythimna loreyi]